MSKRYLSLAKEHMEFLCRSQDSRRVGSKGNIKATEYFDQVINQNGWSTKKTELDVIDWSTDGATITNRGRTIKAFSSPYSLGCSVTAPIQVISPVELNTDKFNT